MLNRCPECGAVWQDGLTCRDHFDQMIAWEFEDLNGAGSVHNLTVLCYNLQHPSVYSPEGLILAKSLLIQFVIDGVNPQQVRKQSRESIDSGRRTYKITGTPESHGVYDYPVNWATTVRDAAIGGLDGYCERVQAWTRSVYDVLKDSGNYFSSETGCS